MSVMISIHAPHTGRDSGVSVTGAELCEFQSTRPIRGATWHTAARWMEGKIFQSTRPIRGATTFTPSPISQNLFQSTRPIRGATADLEGSLCVPLISIHAPHTGRDA